MKQTPLKPTPTTKQPRRKRTIGPIRFAPPPVAGQQAFDLDFDTDEEPDTDE